MDKGRTRRSIGLLILLWVGVAGALAIAARKTEVAARAQALAAAESVLALAVRQDAPVVAHEPSRGPLSPGIERIPAELIASAFGDARVALWRRALESGRVESRYDRRLGALAAVALPGLPPADVLQAIVPEAEIVAERDRFILRALPALLLWTALLSGIGWAMAGRDRRMLQRLERSAAALARGELHAPVAGSLDASGSEISAALEGVRRRLRDSQEEVGRRRSEQDAILSGIAEGVYAVDRDRRVRYVSPRAAALLGVTAEDAIGRFCGDLLRPLAVNGVSPCDSSCPILQARFRGSVRALERIRPGDGREFAAVLSSAPEAGGLQVQIIREESPDEAARRARDAVVADLAHELKTPLAAQRASLELLRERLAAQGDSGGGGRGDRESGELAAGIEAGALRLERLIDNLLESVRIESGELSIRRVDVDLEEVVEEAVGTTGALFTKRGQRLEVDLPFPLPRIVGDPQRLAQALVNLLANAAKFAPEGSEARLGGAVRTSDVELWVEDEGPGLAVHDLPRLSDRYRRGLDESGRAEPRESGSGLGLWIARSIAERHGGALAAERVEGEGRARTRMILRLPLRVAAESQPAAVEPAESQG